METVAEYKPFFEWLWSHLIYIIFGLSVIIQITPIKLNPWSKLFKWLGNAINGEVKESINNMNTTIGSMNTKITNMESEMRANEKDRIRWEVLDFANSCHNGVNHSKDEFLHIITLNDKYKELLKLTKDNNGVFDAEYQYVYDLFQQKQKDNSFL